MKRWFLLVVIVLSPFVLNATDNLYPTWVEFPFERLSVQDGTLQFDSFGRAYLSASAPRMKIMLHIMLPYHDADGNENFRFDVYEYEILSFDRVDEFEYVFTGVSKTPFREPLRGAIRFSAAPINDQPNALYVGEVTEFVMQVLDGSNNPTSQSQYPLGSEAVALFDRYSEFFWGDNRSLFERRGSRP